MNDVSYFEISEKNIIETVFQNISDEQFLSKYFDYEDCRVRFGLRDLLVIPTPQQTLILIVPSIAIELDYNIPFQANLIGKLHFFQMVFGVFSFKYFKIVDQSIANLVRERASNNENYADLIDFKPIQLKAEVNSIGGKILNPACLCGIKDVYVVLDTNNLIQDYAPPRIFVEVSHAEYYSELLKTKAEQNLRKSKNKQKYLIYKGAKIPIPKVLDSSAEAARGYCGFLKGISSADHKTISEGFVFFNNY